MKKNLISGELLQQAARRFKLLGEPARLELLNLMHINGELNVQQLVEATGQQQANVSKHLRLMSEAGFVSRRKAGLYAYYSISDPSLSALCLLVCAQLREEAAAVQETAEKSSVKVQDGREGSQNV